MKKSCAICFSRKFKEGSFQGTSNTLESKALTLLCVLWKLYQAPACTGSSVHEPWVSWYLWEYPVHLRKALVERQSETNQAPLYFAYVYFNPVQGPPRPRPLAPLRASIYQHTRSGVGRIGCLRHEAAVTTATIRSTDTCCWFARQPPALSCSQNITSILVLMHYYLSARK